MSAQPEEKDQSKLEGYGVHGVPYYLVLTWFGHFMERTKEPTIICGMHAFAALWMLAFNRRGGFLIDPQNADIIRTPFGPAKLTVCKSIVPGTALVSDGEDGAMVATANNLQDILP